MEPLMSWSTAVRARQTIKYIPTNSAGLGYFKMGIQNAIDELGYEPHYDVHKLYEQDKEKMKVDRFMEFRDES